MLAYPIGRPSPFARGKVLRVRGRQARMQSLADQRRPGRAALRAHHHHVVQLLDARHQVDDDAPVVLAHQTHGVLVQRQRAQLAQIPQLVHLHDVIDVVPVQVQHRHVRERQELLQPEVFRRFKSF